VPVSLLQTYRRVISVDEGGQGNHLTAGKMPAIRAGLNILKAQKLRRLLALLLAAMLFLHLMLAWHSRDLVRKGYADFTIFYSAGKMVRMGLGPRLYDEAKQYDVQQEFASGVIIRNGPLPYNHPPFEALVFVPFTFLPYFVAYLVWDFINLLILLGLPILLWPYIPILERASPLAWLLSALAFFPAFIDLLQGQDAIPLLLLFTMTFIALKKNADFTAGCWLGLGLFRFHLLLPLLFIFAVQKKWRAILAFLSVALALALISIATVGWGEAVHYPDYVWHVEQVMGRGAIVPADMPNLRGLLDTFLKGLFSKTIITGIVILASIGLLLFLAKLWNRTSTGMRLDLGFSAAVIVTVLVSYHAFAYDLLLLLLPILLLGQYTWSSGPARRPGFLVPALILFVSPIHMLLWFRYGQLNLMALLLLWWLWEISRETLAGNLLADEPYGSPR